jgi:hypothetical protein
MSIDMALGGYLIDVDGVRHQLSVVLNPSNSITENVIKRVSGAGRGVVELERKPTPEVGPDRLTLYVDAGNLLLMLGVNEEDGDYSVRTLTNEMMPNELMTIMGEKYPARAVTRDIGLACAVFNEFALLGDVSLAVVFDSALGYNQSNAGELIAFES